LRFHADAAAVREDPLGNWTEIRSAPVAIDVLIESITQERSQISRRADEHDGVSISEQDDNTRSAWKERGHAAVRVLINFQLESWLDRSTHLRA
jgi:hypothetical protein